MNESQQLIAEVEADLERLRDLYQQTIQGGDLDLGGSISFRIKQFEEDLDVMKTRMLRIERIEEDLAALKARMSGEAS